MNPKKIWCNLPVNNLETTSQFYTKLGFIPNGRNNDLVSFLVGEDKFVMHFFLKDKLAEANKAAMANAQKANEVLFTLSAGSRGQVDEWAKEIEQAGGRLVSKPETFGEDYYGFVFADPDGHRFNVFFMPKLE